MGGIGGVFRKKRVYFSQISNVAIRDKKLSLKAKGLYSLIQSYITLENFTLYKNALKKQCIEGNHSFETAWKELKDRGYLVQYKVREATGMFRYEYELLDRSNQTPVFQGVDNPPYGKVGVYNKTDLNKTDLNNIVKDNYIFLSENAGNYQKPFLEIYEYYFMKYMGYEHPKVTTEQHCKIEGALFELHEEGISIEKFKEGVIEHFEELPPANNGNILAFLHTCMRRFGVDVIYHQ